ncbi:MAG: nucleotidyltransferase substrate binding protein [Oligoflexia bacterium]|nr:nucleotidyltransferase substrate binding protein [Oligoflexia bacterium]
MNEKLLLKGKRQLLKALNRLQYSYSKIEKLGELAGYGAISDVDDDVLETWEGLSSRFGRAAEIFFNNYLRAQVLLGDPGFRGTFRDLLNQSQKLKLVKDTSIWLKIRELRNKAAHEYDEESLEQFFTDIKKYTPILLELKNEIFLSDDNHNRDDKEDD